MCRSIRSDFLDFSSSKTRAATRRRAIYPTAAKQVRESSLPKGHDCAAYHDEGAAEIYWRRGQLPESNLRQRLRGQKEEDDVDAEQLAEVPARKVDGGSVERQDDSAGKKHQDPHKSLGAVKGGLKERVAPGLEKGSDGEHTQSTQRVLDQPAEKRHEDLLENQGNNGSCGSPAILAWLASIVAITAFRIHKKLQPGTFGIHAFIAADQSPTVYLYQTGRFRLSAGTERTRAMRYAGLLVMPAGFFLTIAALFLFPASAPRTAFVLCGIAVEALGLVVAVRGHMQIRGENR